MIGHYLLTLSRAQEDRVLLTAMRPGRYTAPCLVGVVQFININDADAVVDVTARGCRWWPRNIPEACRSVTGQYDRLCIRFGMERSNNAIRNRILSNRARRVLQNRPVQLETVTQ